MTTWMTTRREREAVERWRQAQLRAAGFDAPLAASLAADARIDLHELIELVDRGCAPRLAVRILAPLDGQPAA